MFCRVGTHRTPLLIHTRRDVASVGEVGGRGEGVGFVTTPLPPGGSVVMRQHPSVEKNKYSAELRWSFGKF